MQTEFKEKTYEKYFSNEVARLTNVSFSPDQCDEFYLGFDDAFHLSFDRLILLAPYVRRSRQMHRSGIALSELDHLTEAFVKRMPPFRFNLFAQYKRPDYLRTRGAREWSHWRSPYYRFNVTPHQQRLLELIDAGSHGRAATVYATPAFWRASDLWQFVASEGILDNSNIANAGSLSGHDCYTYCKPGHRGIGHSEPEEIESPPLRQTVSIGVEANEPVEAREHIIKTADIIREAANADDETATLLKQAEEIGVVEAPRRSRVVKALITIIAFSEAFGISTYMHG